MPKRSEKRGFSLKSKNLDLGRVENVFCESERKKLVPLESTIGVIWGNHLINN